MLHILKKNTADITNIDLASLVWEVQHLNHKRNKQQLKNIHSKS